MSSEKTERLVNLTMALLASRRYMTKSEIFRRVEGYAGTQETKERMFERDKDELRSLGIEIDVGGLDPLFEDEAGYRIRPEKFQFPVTKFSSRELGLISTALSLWSVDQRGESSELVRKFQSLGIESESPSDLASFRFAKISEENLISLAKALSQRSTVEFMYRKSGSNEAEKRRVNPLGLGAWRGDWYLVAEDLNRDDVRAFKLQRIVDGIALDKKVDSYEIPEDFDASDYLIMYNANRYSTHLRLRKGAANSLRDRATEISNVDSEWDEAIIPFANMEEAVRELLWYGPDVRALKPPELQERIIEVLDTVIANHG